MKTAQEVLAENTLSRLHREAEEKRLAALVNRVRPPRGQVPFVAQLVAFAAVLVIFAVMGNQTGDYRGVYVVSGVFFAAAVPARLWSLRRREKALLALIEAEAPDLFQRLKDKNIA